MDSSSPTKLPPKKSFKSKATLKQETGEDSPAAPSFKDWLGMKLSPEKSNSQGESFRTSAFSSHKKNVFSSFHSVRSLYFMLGNRTFIDNCFILMQQSSEEKLFYRSFLFNDLSNRIKIVTIYKHFFSNLIFLNFFL